MPGMKVNSRFIRLGGAGKLNLPTASLPDLAITDISGEALSPTAGTITVTVSRAPCTVHWRISSGGAVTDKVADFGQHHEVESAGAHTWTNGGTLTANTQYHVNAWLEDETDETAISSAVGFTTPSTASNAAPTTVTFSGGATSINVNESKGVGQTIGQLVADGTPAPTFAETTDPDSKFTVNSDGSVQLSAALDYGTSTSHTLTATATNSEGNATSATLTVNVTEAVTGGTITPDATVSSLANLVTQLDAWDGDAETATRYIAMTVGDYTGPTYQRFEDYDFAGKVIIYSADENCGATFPPVQMIGCSNLGIYALEIIGIATMPTGETCSVGLTNSTDCIVDNCHISRVASEPSAAGYGGYGVFLKEFCDRSEITNNFIQYHTNTLQCVAQTDFASGWANAILLEGNISGKCFADGWRISCEAHVEMNRNWLPRTRPIDPSGDRHADQLQFKGGVLNAWGNISYLQDPYAEKTNAQGLFGGKNQLGKAYYDPQYTQNIILANAVNGMSVNGTYLTVDPSRECLYNDVIRGTWDPPYGNNNGDITIRCSADYCIVAARNARDNGQGPNGVAIDVGDTKALYPIAIPNSAYADWYAGNLDEDGMIGDMMPPSTSSRAHWNTTDPSGPVGAYLRKKELSEGVHPGNDCCAAVAAEWTAIWNSDNGLTS